MSAAFYCMSSAAYFLGAVGMINSLRLHGHDEPIFLLDLGLADEQRELLAAEAILVDAPEGVHPWLAKTVAPLAHPADTMVLIDADVVVTRPLGELIERAAGGRAIAFENDVDRFVPEWGEALALGELRRRPYACSGLVLLGSETAAKTLMLLEDRQRRVEFESSFFARDDPGYLLRFLDQDVLNAILQSRVEPERYEVLPFRQAPMPPFDGLAVVDEARLRCAYPNGEEPYALHHYGAKPWLEPTHDGVYSRLLRRLLTGDDVAIRVLAGDLPLRLRRGPLAFADRKRIDFSERLRYRREARR